MIKRFIDIFLIRSWWVISFLLLCLFLYEQGMQKREWQYRQLTEQLHLLQMKKKEALQRQQNLQLQINSQSDLAWIELTLMRGLGLSPEDQQKIYFTSEKMDDETDAND